MKYNPLEVQNIFQRLTLIMVFGLMAVVVSCGFDDPKKEDITGAPCAAYNSQLASCGLAGFELSCLAVADTFSSCAKEAKSWLECLSELSCDEIDNEGVCVDEVKALEDCENNT